MLASFGTFLHANFNGCAYKQKNLKLNAISILGFHFSGNHFIPTHPCTFLISVYTSGIMQTATITFYEFCIHFGIARRGLQ